METLLIVIKKVFFMCFGGLAGRLKALATDSEFKECLRQLIKKLIQHEKNNLK